MNPPSPSDLPADVVAYLASEKNCSRCRKLLGGFSYSVSIIRLHHELETAKGPCRWVLCEECANYSESCIAEMFLEALAQRTQGEQ